MSVTCGEVFTRDCDWNLGRRELNLHNQQSVVLDGADVGRPPSAFCDKILVDSHASRLGAGVRVQQFADDIVTFDMKRALLSAAKLLGAFAVYLGQRARPPGTVFGCPGMMLPVWKTGSGFTRRVYRIPHTRMDHSHSAAGD